MVVYDTPYGNSGAPAPLPGQAPPPEQFTAGHDMHPEHDNKCASPQRPPFILVVAHALCGVDVSLSLVRPASLVSFVVNSYSFPPPSSSAPPSVPLSLSLPSVPATRSACASSALPTDTCRASASHTRSPRASPCRQGDTHPPPPRRTLSRTLWVAALPVSPAMAVAAVAGATPHAV